MLTKAYTRQLSVAPGVWKSMLTAEWKSNIVALLKLGYQYCIVKIIRLKASIQIEHQYETDKLTNINIYKECVKYNGCSLPYTDTKVNNKNGAGPNLYLLTYFLKKTSAGVT